VIAGSSTSTHGGMSVSARATLASMQSIHRPMRGQGDAHMDMWKGEKLHGPDRRMTRVHLEESDRTPIPRLSVMREPAQAARGLGALYVKTRGRSPKWRAAVLGLARLAR
jgi:hypothetical protein